MTVDCFKTVRCIPYANSSFVQNVYDDDTVYGTRYTVYGTRYTVYGIGIRYTVYGIRYTVYGIRYRYTVHGTRYTVYGTRYTVYGIPTLVYARLFYAFVQLTPFGWLPTVTLFSCF